MSQSEPLSGMSTVAEAFRAQAEATPDRVALVVGATELTYAEVAERADRLAAVLREAGVGPDRLVGVCLPRAAWIVPALLGVWRAGGACVPLDPAYPADRLRVIADDARLAWVVTSAGSRAAVPAGDARHILVEELPPAAGDPGPPGDPGHLAYVLYTSGSTGRPKGAAIEHGNVLSLLRWAVGAYSTDELAGSLAAASVSFDFSILEIFAPLCAGGTVVLAENLLALPALPARDRVRMICAVPSALSVVLDLGLPRAVGTVSTGGERLTGGLRDRLYRAGVRRVVNTYGPTECTTACLAHEVRPDERGEPPIGSPIAGARLTVRDPEGRVVPDGQPGELWIAGPGVSRGYLSRPDLTAERFVHGEYRSGDLVRVVDGVFHYLGRLDDQVKIRGYRVELGEVHAHLAAHPAVRSAAVVAVDDALGTQRLVGYAQLDPAVPEAELRAHLLRRLPAFMVPERIVEVDRLPLRPNGKVDRSALPEIPLNPLSTVEVVEPTDPLERRIAAVVAEVLGVPAVGTHTPLGEYGWHSLAAGRICARVAEEHGVAVPVADLLARPTVAELAERVRTGTPTTGPGPATEPVTEYPPTRMQRQFWALRQVTGFPEVTTVAIRFGVDGADRAALDDALARLVERHEALRTRVVEVDGVPVARIGDTASVVFDVTPLDDRRAEVTLRVDHTVFDGWSIGVLLTELAALLAGAPLPATPRLSDAALAEAGRPADREATTVHWGRSLCGATVPDDLPGTPRTGPPRGTGGRVTLPLDAALPELVREVAARYGATPYAVYAAALAVLVDCLTSRADVLLGVAAATRRDEPGLDRLVGPLLDVLPVRLDLADDPPFAELMRSAGARLVEALPYRALTAPEIAAAAGLSRPAGSALTPVVLSVQPESVPVVVTTGGVRVTLLGELPTGAAQNDLGVYVNATVDGTQLQVEYADDRFTGAQATAFAERYVRLLRQAVADPGRPVSTLDGLLPAERRHLLALGDGGSVDATPVPAAVLARADERPGATAVVDDTGRLTYAEFVDAARRVAGGLRRSGVLEGDLVAVCLPRDRYLPAALLGVWLAGAAYVPVDPDLPAARRELLAAGTRCTLSTVDLDAPRLAVPPDPARLAYVLYTSGSTGVPKGVEVTHANLGAAVGALRAEPGYGLDDVFLAVSPVSFDLSCVELWVPLTAGARTVVVDRGVAVDGVALAERLGTHGVTALDVTPTLLRVLLAGGWTGDPGLRVVSGGEALDRTLADELIGRVGALWNAYGPTETTITATLHRVMPGGTGPVPIGRPTRGTRAYVLDRAGRPVPPGVPGELWLGGSGVTRGYRGDPALTAERFGADPTVHSGRWYRTGDLARWTPDGTLEFLGRRDGQVKLRGYRIELGEIEAAVRAQRGVADAAVTLVDGRLVGYLVGDVDPVAVERAAFAALPAYEVPRAWVVVPALPRTPSGKLDRTALLEYGAPIAPSRAPGTDLERYVCALWTDVLGVTDISAGADFFALGGDSLAATRVALRLRADLSLDLGARLLFEHPVLADFAAELERAALALLAVEAR